jgi:hypothetical protein
MNNGGAVFMDWLLLVIIVCCESSVWLCYKYERLSYLETVSVGFMSLFYSSNSSGCESSILLFRPAVIKCRYELQQVSCDFLTFGAEWDCLANCN